MDSTVQATAVTDSLLGRLAPEGHELVLFDVARGRRQAEGAVQRILSGEYSAKELTAICKVVIRDREALAALHGKYRLLLVTKGDLFHQEAKLAASGLGDLFTGIEIVSDKKPATFAAIGTRLCPVIPGDVFTSRIENVPS